MGCEQSIPSNQMNQYNSFNSTKIEELRKKYKSVGENIHEEKEIRQSQIKMNELNLTKVSSKRQNGSSLRNNTSLVNGSQVENKENIFISNNVLFSDDNVALQQVMKMDNRNSEQEMLQKQQMYDRVHYRDRYQKSVYNSAISDIIANNAKVSQTDWAEEIKKIQNAIHNTNQMLAKKSTLDIENSESIDVENSDKLCESNLNNQHGFESVQVKEDFNSINQIKQQISNNYASLENYEQFLSKN